jgi:glycosyltransferase involved in cell wall biosynthesis
MSKASFPFEHLVVIHYHWRPGGVRRVVELTLPAIAAAAGTSLKRITLLSGGTESERPELGTIGLPTDFIHEPACDYFSNQAETPESISENIQRALWRVMKGSASSRTLIWFQNPALARNAILCREVAKISKETGVALILHHHDFWCAGRWARWNELEKCGCHDLSSAADVLFASGTRSVHAGINLRDFQTLKRCFPASAFHLPNPVLRPAASSPANIDAAKAWVAKELNSEAPLWIYPTRFLRRKNLLEAILLTRWLRPDAILATTSGQYSQDEANYAHDLKQAAAKHGWRVHFGLLDKPSAPRVTDLLQIAEAVVHTSVQEGFGMTFVETAASGTPLVARAIPAVMPDLAAMGFEFPQLYNDIQIAPGLFDVEAEMHRQSQLAHSAREHLPVPFQKIFPALPADARDPFSFSSLTRRAQVEVLSHPPAESWRACEAFNPYLAKIRNTRLAPTPWPTQAPHTPTRYAEEFLRIASSIPDAPPDLPLAAETAQMEITSQALGPDSIYPIQLES